MRYRQLTTVSQNRLSCTIDSRYVVSCITVCIIISCVYATFVSCTSSDFVRYRTSTNYIQSVSNIKYEDLSKIQKPFKTNGYYTLKEKDPDLVEDIEYILIFYDDGTFSRHRTKGIKESHDTIDIDKYIQKCNVLFNNGEYYGAYFIDGDTIFVNEYRRDLFGYDIYKLKYYIINNETIVNSYLEDPQQVYKGETIKWDKNDEYIFKPAILPKPRDKFLKKKQWYWKNEADWRQYMAR